MSAVIKLEHIDVTFKSKARTVQAVHDVSLEVEKRGNLRYCWLFRCW